MNISTKRLLISEIKQNEKTELIELFQDRDNLQYEDFHLELMNDREYEVFIDSFINSRGYYSIRKKDTNAFVGIISMGLAPKTQKHVAGVILKSEYQKQGYAFEAVNAYLYAFFKNSNEDCVYAYCIKDNVNGNSSASRVFCRGKHSPIVFFDKALGKDVVKYCISREEFYQSLSNADYTKFEINTSG